MAITDLAGFMSQLKDHAVEHGLHIHDERHLVETYSLKQSWEVDLHPESSCNGPLDLQIALEVDPRVLLGFEDAMVNAAEDADPPDGFNLECTISWSLPPITEHVDLLSLTLDLAGYGGVTLPITVSAMDTFPSVTDSPTRTLGVVGRYTLSLAKIYLGEDVTCELLEKTTAVSTFLLDKAAQWIAQA
ncbi:MAG: hypothetical protein ACP5O0_10170 [Acidimicrobiales bacterium]